MSFGLKAPKPAIFLLLLSFVSLMSACLKHGEDDPWLSFVTRNDRLTRLWELQTYTLDSDNNIDINTVFSSTACDTANIGGITINNLSREESLADTVLNAFLVETEGITSNTRIYNIKLTYFLDIRNDGTYTADGIYSYNNADLNAEVSGSFQSGSNNWYWEAGIKTDWAITLLYFPTIDASAIVETGQPLRYVAAQTFDLRELRQNDLQLEAEASTSTTVAQHFLPYNVILPFDTVYNCERTITTQTDFSTNQNWTFLHKSE